MSMAMFQFAFCLFTRPGKSYDVKFLHLWRRRNGSSFGTRIPQNSYDFMMFPHFLHQLENDFPYDIWSKYTGGSENVVSPQLPIHLRKRSVNPRDLYLGTLIMSNSP